MLSFSKELRVLSKKKASCFRMIRKRKHSTRTPSEGVIEAHVYVHCKLMALTSADKRQPSRNMNFMWSWTPSCSPEEEAFFFMLRIPPLQRNHLKRGRRSRLFIKPPLVEENHRIWQILWFSSFCDQLLAPSRALVRFMRRLCQLRSKFEQYTAAMYVHERRIKLSTKKNGVCDPGY